MVQGCDINIMDVKSTVPKSIKVAVPTEEQKRLAQLSHIERIDTWEDNIIKQMVEVTKHTYDECAMELAGTNMDLESAITNLLEGNSEEWETKVKKPREKKPAITETTDSKAKRSASKTDRGRSTKTEESRDSADRSRSTRGTRGVSSASRGGSVGARGAARGGASMRGVAGGRGRAGKRQLPPRMDRQRNYSGSRESQPRDFSAPRESQPRDFSAPRETQPRDSSSHQNGLPRESSSSPWDGKSSRDSRDSFTRDSRDSFRTSGRGRANGSYRHNYRGGKRPTEHEASDWGSSNGVDSTNYTAEWREEGGGSWTREDAWDGDENSGWGANSEESTRTWDGLKSEKSTPESQHPTQAPPHTAPEVSWSSGTPKVLQKEAVVEETQSSPPSNWSSEPASRSQQQTPQVLTHKRPAYTQAFTSPLSSMLASSEFAPTTSSTFSFPFSQQPSSVSADYKSRHEQAPGTSPSSLLKLQESFKSGPLKLQESFKSGPQIAPPGRKISVEQLFQMHENTGNSPGTLRAAAALSTSDALRGMESLHETPNMESEAPSSPPTSCTSSNNSTSRKQGKRVSNRTIPSEPVEMPGSAVESLDVQFGSIGFGLDTTEEDVGEESPGPPCSTPTSSSKMDAATCTTPRDQDSAHPAEIPGIHQVKKETVSAAVQPSPPRASAYPSHATHAVNHATHVTSVPNHVHSTSHVSSGSSGHVTNHMASGPSHAPTPSSAPTMATAVQQPGNVLSGQGGQSTGPPNLPPPNMDNIRTANNLITSHGTISEPNEHQHSAVATTNTQFGQSKRSGGLPPGVYPTSSVRSSSSLYYSDASSNHPQVSQSSGYDMSRYYSSNSGSTNFETHQQHSHRQQAHGHQVLQQQQAQQQQAQQAQQQQHAHPEQHSAFGGADKQQHYSSHRSSDITQQLASTNHHPPHANVGAGLTASGISSTTAAPSGMGTAAAGYPTAPLLAGYHYPHPIHPYPNNLYAPNYYAAFNPLTYPQTQKQTVPSYAGGASTFGASEAASSQGQFGNDYNDYKDLYAPSGATKHPSHLPVTTSTDYNKMQAVDKNMFNIGYLQFPNYIQHMQGQGQAAAAMIQQQTNIQGRAMEQARTAGSSLNKHQYWSHR